MAGPGAKAGRGKLSLKRRRENDCSPAAFFTKASLFENQDLSDAETSWSTLLRALDPQMNCSSLEKFASLPEFLSKSAQIANSQPKPETFNTGMKGSQWVPFPVFRRENNKATNSRNQQSSSTETVTLIGENQQEEAFGAVALVPKPKSQNNH